MADGASEHAVAIQDFKAKLRSCTTEAACKRSYVLVSKLTQWLRSKVQVLGFETTQASRLLHFAHRHSLHGTPVRRQTLSDGENPFLLIFSILLELDMGDLIFSFIRSEKGDIHLPIDLYTLKEIFKSNNVTDPEERAKAFDDAQWRYAVPRFELEKVYSFHRNRILPICRKKPINEKGGTAKLWQIEVLEEFVGPRLKQAVRNSCYDPKNGDNLGLRYQFALKVFEESNITLYNNERSAFFTLRDHGGMIRYLGDFDIQEPKPKQIISRPGSTAVPHLVLPEESEEIKTTYNILLEYGESDLDELFSGRLPPVLQDEVEAFWKGLFDVADTVERIHNWKINDDGMVKEYRGWHADIKPDNILIIEEDGPLGIKMERFKLADPGFAKFVEKRGPDPMEVPLSGGTETYGAPERHRGRQQTLSAQTIDTWSLGCVFSITATWIVLGYQGIRQYSQLREKEIRRLIGIQAADRSISSDNNPKLTPGDYFHDGREVLDVVTSWHSLLRKHLRKSDTITARILDLVDDKMLNGSPNSRIKAKPLCQALQKISTDSKADLRTTLPEKVLNFLLEVDQEASAEKLDPVSTGLFPNGGQSGNTYEDRKARKSKLLDAPLMKTTHRSSYLKSTLAPPANSIRIGPTRRPSIFYTPQSTFHGPSLETPTSNPSGYEEIDLGLSLQTVESPTQLKGDEIYNHNSIADISQYSPSLISPTIPISRKKAKSTKPRDVFQAREEVEKRRENRPTYSLRLKNRAKDTLLARHYYNRDIVFLVDNAETMADHWYRARFVLETMLWLVEGLDEDGMDLHFTIGSAEIESSAKVTRFLKKMNAEDVRPKPGMHTDMRRPLNDIFASYYNETKKRVDSKTKVKCLTLIILTDGIWSGMSNKQEVEGLITKFVGRLEKLIGRSGDRTLSIEFVQFGEDPEATRRLRRLDDDLVYSGIDDIIDTEHARGNINKMLLGSFVEEFDDEDEEEMAIPLPQTLTQNGESRFSTYSFQTEASAQEQIHATNDLPLNHSRSNSRLNLSTRWKQKTGQRS